MTLFLQEMCLPYDLVSLESLILKARESRTKAAYKWSKIEARALGSPVGIASNLGKVEVVCCAVRT